MLTAEPAADSAPVQPPLETSRAPAESGAASQSPPVLSPAARPLGTEQIQPTPTVAASPPAPEPVVFRPGAADQLAPTGAVARVRANLEALRVLRDLQRAARPATAAQQAVLSRWSGWGAVPQVFDHAHEEFAWARDALTELLDPTELAGARRNTLNAHYTDLSLVAPIWSALTRLGFDGGRVLEPGCGTGNFIGMAPAGAQMVGVELEPVTAAIAAALYPGAQILTESFADTRAPRGSFDLVLGNVPFAKAALTDPAFNPGRHSIHNHFIIKSLHLLAPGGLVAVITSRYTLDAANPAARREMAALADLVGAIRLPPSAHQRTAGTQVVTDLLVLRRREDEFEPTPFDWELTELVDLAHHRDPVGATGAGELAPVRVNSYFTGHPEMVCGQLVAARGQFSDAELSVSATQPAAELLAAKLGVLVERAQAAELTHRPSALTGPARRAALVGRAAEVVDGHIAADGDGFTTVSDGAIEAFAVPGTQQRELRELLGLRDGVVALLEAEAASVDTTPEIERLRAHLNTGYDRYVHTHGPINRFTWRRTGRTHPETGQPVMARIPPRHGGFRADPHAPLVYALEDFDPTSQQATKAPILSRRVIAPRAPRLGADSPADALAICMDTLGRVELTEIARLLGLAEPEARAALGTLVFEDPTQHDRLVPAAEYLSGNVREKLAAARTAQAAETATETGEAGQVTDRYAANVAALAAVVPADIAPEDIVARLGAVWIAQPYVQQFLRETVRDPHLVAEHAYGVQWTVKGNAYGVAATSTWGTEDMPAPELAQLLLQAGLSRPGPSPITLPAVVGIGGHAIDATLRRDRTYTGYELTVAASPTASITGSATELADAALTSLPIRLENLLVRLDRLLTEAHTTIDTCREEITRAETQLEQPFAYIDELDTARRTCADLDQALADLAADTPAPDIAAPDTTAPDTTAAHTPGPAATGGDSRGPTTDAGADEPHPAMSALATLTPPQRGRATPDPPSHRPTAPTATPSRDHPPRRTR